MKLEVNNKLDYENNTYFAMCNLNDDKDLKIVRQEGNELVEFFDFELLTKLVYLFDSQNKMNSEIN